MHRLRAVADQRREMVDVERVAGFGDKADPGAESGVHQMLAHRPDREQHRDRGPPLVRPRGR